MWLCMYLYSMYLYSIQLLRMGDTFRGVEVKNRSRVVIVVNSCRVISVTNWEQLELVQRDEMGFLSHQVHNCN